MVDVNLSDAASVAKTTPDKILFGAGTYNYGVKIDATGKVTSVGTFLGCTNGGGKFAVKPTFATVELDQSTVARKGLDIKQGEEATIETNWTEIKSDELGRVLIANVADGTDCKIITSKETIDAGDYFEDFAYIGKTVTGKPVIVYFKTALCTSGLEVESKKSEQASPTIAFKCVADLDSASNTLPYKIIWPSVGVAPAMEAGGK
ncbi:MAG: hypothetical protein RR178_05230 [Gordonibacter sp.]